MARLTKKQQAIVNKVNREANKGTFNFTAREEALARRFSKIQRGIKVRKKKRKSTSLFGYGGFF